MQRLKSLAFGLTLIGLLLALLTKGYLAFAAF